MNPYIGKRLGSYQLLEQIGQGGMATIFKAYQPSMDRYVAVKILPAHFTEDESFVARFTQEARTLAHLEHPHILPVHDYGEQEGITYLVMRYVDAGTLKDLIVQRGPLEPDETARILGQVCRALGYAHSQGIVHRDVKPTNVLIDERGDAFLTDFGIAKLVAGTAQFTATGAVVGTPAYMSPEQGMGQPLDHRCDIYALGVMLYEIVTGRVPFDAETPLAILMQHVNAPLPPPRQIKPSVPEAVERVILKAMAKLPADRFQSAEEMGETLHRAVAGLPTEIALPPQPVPGPTAVVQQPVAAPAEPPPSYKPVDKTRVAVPARKPRKRIPWLPVVGSVAALAVMLVAALLILPNLGGGEVEATPIAASPPPPGWTNYSDGNFVHALVRQDGYLWAGGRGGLVRWDLEDGSYVKLGIADGLASGQVNDLLVDDDGDLWVATEAGISRFDGEGWVTFDEADGLDTQWVLCLFLDGDGALWAGTAYGERGLNYYDYDEGTWGPPPIPPMPLDFPRPWTMARDGDGVLYVGLNERGLATFDGGEWRVLTSGDGLPGDQVHDLLLVDDETLLASFGREVVRFDLEGDEWETIPQLSGPETYRIYQADDDLWFVGEGGATRYDPETSDWERFESDPDTIPAWAATAITEDDDGIWLGTDGGGVVLFDGTDWEIWVTDDQLGGNEIETISQDRAGVLWFTLPGRGLTRHDPANDTWRTFGEGDGALGWPSVPGLDSQDHLWVGGYGELRWYDGNDWRSVEPAPLADVTVYGVTFGPGDVMWLWGDAGVMRHDPAAGEWTSFAADDHPVLGDATIMYVADDGAAWVGGYGGLVRYDGSDWGTPDAAGSPPNDADDPDVHAIAAAPDDSLWVAAGGDLYHLDGGQWSRFSWPDDWIGTMAVAPDGTVWVGSDSALGHFDPLSRGWQTLSPEHGLIHHEVRAIHVTPDGVVWIGTGGGVSRYVPEG
jgi:ligand-binding sensor domain-containing protein/tRNA A-37 threonylcarbamoyl transferase component Bud32